MLLTESNETSRNLGEEHDNDGICETSVRRIVIKYKDKNDETDNAAKQFYENHASHSQPATSRGNSAQLVVDSRAVTHSTHPAQTAAAQRQPSAAVAGQSAIFLSEEQLPTMAQLPLQYFGVFHNRFPRSVCLCTEVVTRSASDYLHENARKVFSSQYTSEEVQAPSAICRNSRTSAT